MSFPFLELQWKLEEPLVLCLRSTSGLLNICNGEIWEKWLCPDVAQHVDNARFRVHSPHMCVCPLLEMWTPGRVCYIAVAHLMMHVTVSEHQFLQWNRTESKIYVGALYSFRPSEDDTAEKCLVKRHNGGNCVWFEPTTCPELLP